ncbi:SGNH/GDSL hydrolase family protein [Sphingomonas sp.]|jgi:lysophospholipase L1-like esterase|uniref:SGNH/GDSL hydrolase family protein n=1 Tax=Sphingomonas sp. TaxID=28214 RepID=UPI002D7E52AA|nr:SGNH/GDSL hydrolase family protein [Sphingomonas sp.]HEU0045071.1 SGNH/GDSL hydrolase family protein [Sphingomonas sp.]
MQTAARLALAAWRNDDVYEIPIRVRGVDLTSVALAMQVRLRPDTPGTALIDLAKVTNGNQQGLRVAGITTVAEVVESDLRVRINKSTLQSLAYAGEVGDPAPFSYALLIGGRTRLYGDFHVLAHAYGSDGAPLTRPLGLSTVSSAAPDGGATLTVAADGGATVTIDGADLVSPLATQAQAAAVAAGQAAAALGPLAATFSVKPTDGYLRQWTDAYGRQSAGITTDGTFEIFSGRVRYLTVLNPVSLVGTIIGAVTARAAPSKDLKRILDPYGRLALAVEDDGSVIIGALRDGKGRLVTPRIDANTAAIAALQTQALYQAPVQRLRLKRALYDAQARQIMAADPVTVSAFTTATSISGGVGYAKNSPRIRLLGGPWVAGTGFPGATMMYQRSVTYNGSTGGVSAGNTVFEFLLIGDSFEYYTLGTGGPGNWSLEIDGVATNDAGYPSAPNNTGGGYYHLVTLPVGGGIARRIRITTPGRPFGGINVPAGATLLDSTPARTSSMVVIGDSITEGSVATAMWRRWANQLAYQLGIDNVDVSGVGGSGYLNALGYNGNNPRAAGFPDYRFRERINDVLTAISGGPPDLLVVAGGINDSALDPAAVGAEALLYFKALRAAAPDMAIVVLGPFWGDAAYPASLLAIRDAIFAAAAQVKRVATVDVSGWYARSDRSTWFNGGANGPHPIDVGHAAYGQLAAAAISPIIAAF